MEKHYVCIVGFEAEELDKEGNPKIKRVRYLVNAMSFVEAMSHMTDYLKVDTRGWDIKGLTEAKFEDIINNKESKVSKL